MPPAGEISDFPGISVNRYGKGTAFYVAAPVFRTYWNNNHFWVRTYCYAIYWIIYDREKYFEVEAPVHIEANMMEKDGKKYLHLINYQSIHAGEKSTSFYNPIENITPVHEIQVYINDKRIRAERRPNESLVTEETEERDCFYGS